MATSSSNPDALPNHSPSGQVTLHHDHISEDAHASYQDGQLTWDGGSLGDENIITITHIDSRQNEHVIWSLVPVDTASGAKEPPFTLQSTPATNLPSEFLSRHLLQVLPDHLDLKSTDIYVLISTRSGTGLALDFFNNVLQPLLKAIGLPDSAYTAIQTENAESVKKFAHSTLLVGAHTDRKQTVLLLSGDGGTVDTVNGLLEKGSQARYFFSQY